MPKDIGDMRTFDKYPGNWIIEKIEKNMTKQYNYIFKDSSIVCPHCGKSYEQRQNFIITTVETLRNGKDILHLGITQENRYLILEEAKEIFNGN